MLPVYTLHLHCSMGHWDRDTRCILPVRDVCVVHVPGDVCIIKILRVVQVPTVKYIYFLNKKNIIKNARRASTGMDPGTHLCI